MNRNNKSSKHSEYTDYTDYTCSRSNRKSRSRSGSDYYSRYSDESCRSKSRSSYDHCYDDCRLEYSHTPIGVWNLVFQYETNTSNNTTTTMEMERPSQLLLNGDCTFTNNSTPDLKNNPFGVLLSTGVGVWQQTGDRKLKLEATHIGYKASDGSPTVYYKVYITMKLNRKRTKVRFCGQAVPKNLDDPSLCTETDGAIICFGGHGYKVLEPNKA